MPLITYSDIIEFREKLISSKLSFFVGKISPSSSKRIESHWNAGPLAPINWWNIPLIRERWNKKITNTVDTDYVKYTIDKYFFGKDSLSMLSIGCGTGSQEIAFSDTNKFTWIDAIDIAKENIVTANKRNESNRINFTHSSFEEFNSDKKYDLILFHSSLHHLKNIPTVLNKVNNLLSKDGILVIHEYTGPNRINWNRKQIEVTNQILSTLPEEKRTYYSSGRTKRKQTAPGKLRMIISDPSEAIESESLLPELKNRFNTLELKGYGGNILVPLLKGISHHFSEKSPENELYLYRFFDLEDEFLQSNIDDYHFGVFAKKKGSLELP